MSNPILDPLDVIAGQLCPFCKDIEWDAGEISILPIIAARGIDRTPSANESSVIRVAVFTCQGCRYVAMFSLEPLIEKADPNLYLAE